MLAAKSATQPDSSPISFKSAKAFETWLKKNHASSDGLWLKLAKRGADEPSVTIGAAGAPSAGASGSGGVCWVIGLTLLTRHE